MFRITGGKGFQITFENGWTVSVQFGPANYCDNYERRIGQDEEVCGREGSDTAEIAVWEKDGPLLPFPSDTVEGWCTPARVLEVMQWAAAGTWPYTWTDDA